MCPNKVFAEVLTRRLSPPSSHRFNYIFECAQYELGADYYFIRISKTTDQMVDMLRTGVESMAVDNIVKSPLFVVDRGTQRTRRVRVVADDFREGDGDDGNCSTPKFVVHELGYDLNRFLDTVVDSVKVSARINLRVEGYS